MGFLTPDNVYHATPSASHVPMHTAPQVPVLKAGASLPVLVTKQMSQTERMTIFNKSISPQKKSSDKAGATSSKDSSTTAKTVQGTPISNGSKKVTAVAATVDLVDSDSVARAVKRPFDACVPVRSEAPTEEVESPRRKSRNTEANRIRDRTEVMRWAPSMSIGTDLDLPLFHKANGVLWVPEVLEHDPVDDFTRYCFACHSQHRSTDRAHCDAIGCKRYMFIDCGRYMDPNANDNYYDDDDVETFPEFRCCTCSSMSREEMARLFEDYMDSLPPKRTSVLGFST